jgi:hypothetical protein
MPHITNLYHKVKNYFTTYKYTIRITNESEKCVGRQASPLDNNDYLQNAINYYVENNITKTNQYDMVHKYVNNKYRNTFVPTKYKWIQIYKNDSNEKIWLYIDVNETNAGATEKTSIMKKTTYTLTSRYNIISTFIESVIECYEAFLNKRESRFYINISKIFTPEDNKAYVSSDSYALRNSKTFESIFFNNKDVLLTAIDTFIQKKGIFSLPSTQHRIGILMHGPPGTGKTSIIKALANSLDRHIVNINLSKIKTNKQLFTVMYDLRYLVNNYWMTFDYKDLIFVIEDIDAVGPIVLKRNASESESDATTDCTDSDSEHSSIVKIEQILTEQMIKKNKKSKRGGKDGDSVDIDDDVDDKLTLAGLLNAIDGVIDCPGRVMIFTSNHPEKLDEALIRPGRIDFKLELGPLNIDNTIKMLNYYGFSISSEQETLLRGSNMSMTGAEVEQFVMKHGTDFDKFIEVNINIENCDLSIL